MSVNRSWDEYCKQLQLNHTQQVAALSAELSDVRQRLADRQKADDERQRDFDELLLSAKKQRQDEEVHVLYCFSTTKLSIQAKSQIDAGTGSLTHARPGDLGHLF